MSEGPRWWWGLPLWLGLILALGIGLRTVQYTAQVDLWHDELALARNVEDRGLGGLLTRPLDHRQVAPAAFMALLEVSSWALGASAVGLRLVPWLVSLASVLLFWRVARRFAGGAGLLAGLALFAVSPALVWYGSSVKPYGSDVAVSLLLVWLALRYLERPGETRRGAIAGAAGGAALLISFPAVPTAAVLGAILVVAWWRRDPRPPLAPLATLAAGWIAAAALAGGAALALLDPATDAFMEEFWAEDFPPLADPVAASAWTAKKLFGAFAHSVVFFPPENPVLGTIVALPLVLAAAGLVLGLRRRDASWWLLLAPPAAGLGAAFAHLLPFDQRLGLHAVWPVLVLAGGGLSELEGLARGRWRWVARALAGVTALPLVAIVLLAARPPYAGDGEVRPREVLEELARRHRTGEPIYVYTQGRHDMAFYGGRAGLEGWIQGERHYDDPRGYLREADDLRGRPRAWFVWVRLDRDEPGFIRSYLETIGRELERIPEGEAGDAGAVLYDLSDPLRLEAASAESFPLSALESRGGEGGE